MIVTDKFGDVTRIKMGHELGGKVLYWVSVYFIDGLLIDTGPSHASMELARFMEGKTLDGAINTHYHEDHVGGNYLLMEKFGIEIFAHREAVPYIKNPPPILEYQKSVWGEARGSSALPVGNRVKTGRFAFEIIDIPGHSRGDIALFEPMMRWCFSGDLFITERPKTARREEDVLEMLSSMKKLLALDGGDFTLFTSGEGVFPEGREALGVCVAHLEKIGRRARALYGQKKEIEDIVTEMFGRETSLATLTDGDFSSANLIRSILGLKKEKP